MKKLLEILFWFVLSAVTLMGCAQEDKFVYVAVGPTLSDASPEACPNGGVTFSSDQGELKTVCNGQNGVDGISPSSITVVQFCSGTTQYPSTFMEIGFCIDGELYGVYSANNGFLTHLPPGSYNSNAIGNSCSFTILPNCGVQQ